MPEQSASLSCQWNAGGTPGAVIRDHAVFNAVLHADASHAPMSGQCPTRKLWCAPAGSRATRLPAAAARMGRFGHQATQRTLAPRFQARMLRPLRTSHTRTWPSSEPDASHCPCASIARLRTCRIRCFPFQHSAIRDGAGMHFHS